MRNEDNSWPCSLAEHPVVAAGAHPFTSDVNAETPVHNVRIGRQEVERNQIIYVNAELVCDRPPIFLGQFVKWAVYNACLRRHWPVWNAFLRRPYPEIKIDHHRVQPHRKRVTLDWRAPRDRSHLASPPSIASLILNRPGLRRRGGGRRSTTVICAHSLTHSRKQLLIGHGCQRLPPPCRLRRQRPSSACHARQSGSAKTRFAPVIPELRVHERCEQKKPRNVQYQIELHSAALIAHHCLSCAATASPCPQTIPGSGSRHASLRGSNRRRLAEGSHGRTKRLADLVAKAAPGRATLRFSRRTPFALRTMSSSAGFRSGGPDPERQAGIPERRGASPPCRPPLRRSSTGSRAARRRGLVIARPCRRAG